MLLLTQDWPSHKLVCKPGIKPTKSETESLVLHKSSLEKRGEKLTLDDEDLSSRGPGISVELPSLSGEKATLTATNISPEFLKQMREDVNNMAATKGGSSA